MNIRDMGIKSKLIIINSLFVILLIGALTAVFLQHSKKELVENLEHDSLSFSTHLAHNSTLALLSKNRELVDRYIDGLLKDPDVVYGALYFSDGTLFLEKNKEGYEEYEGPEVKGSNSKSSMVRDLKYGVFSIIEASSPVLLERIEGGREEIGLLSDIFPAGEADETELRAEIVGFAVVALSAERPMERFLAVSARWIMIAIILSALTISMIIIAVNRFTAPLINLSMAAERVAGGDLDVVIASASKDEVGTLATAFNDMIVSIKANIVQIRKSQEEMAAIFNGITDYIWVVDPDCVVLRVNKEFASKVGANPEELVGVNCRDIFFLDETFCDSACFIKRCRKDGFSGTSLEFKDTEGERTYEMRTFPLFDSEVGLKGGINYLKDISDVKLMETKLIHSEKLAATGRMAADVAHEVNNPLGIIKNYLTMIKREMKGADHSSIKSLDVIDEEISRIAEIIKGLLVFSRPELKNEEFLDINKTIEDIVNLVRSGIGKRAVNFEMDLDCSISKIKISSGHLKQVMINLINNALDAMPDGGRLTIKTFDRADGASIYIEDSGSGIREEDLKEIFTPFFTTKGVKGTGLGLAISYGIIKGYGGDINLRSKEEKGVVASVFLPYKKEESYND